eukprot:SAG11_NODE_292_length_11180_cov_6.023825_1_plen_62_part_00
MVTDHFATTSTGVPVEAFTIVLLIISYPYRALAFIIVVGVGGGGGWKLTCLGGTFERFMRQ